MSNISEAEFQRLVTGIAEDRDVIIRHNPIGTDDEILLWMLLSCLISYLSLEPVETPCFSGKPDTETYRSAILSVLKNRTTEDFDPEPHLARLSR